LRRAKSIHIVFRPAADDGEFGFSLPGKLSSLQKIFELVFGCWKGIANKDPFFRGTKEFLENAIVGGRLVYLNLQSPYHAATRSGLGNRMKIEIVHCPR
jgi:hypothetical protein